MTPELGHLALILALCVALVQGTLPILGAQRGQAAWIAIARPAPQTHLVVVALAIGCLMLGFLYKYF
jgi:cytochrome c-type biogenesis protein CcmF